MKSSKRALRRHHRQRMIRRAYRSYALAFIRDPEEQRQRVLGWYNNMAKCSCWMCGNPRRYGDGPTLQERKQVAEACEDLLEPKARRRDRR